MSDEDKKLLEAVRNWRPPKELHPICMAAYGVYAEHDNALPPEAIRDLRRVLDGYGDDLEALAAAMEGMIRFMLYLGEILGDKENGEKVAKLLGEYADRFEPFWQRVAEALENQGGNVQEAFQQMIGDKDPARKTAPLYGQKPPAGTVRLADIAPPPRPPPWVPKNKS